MPEVPGCSERALYPLQVLDESMEPEFPRGCIIVIEPAQGCDDGAYVVIRVEEERWFRQMIKQGEHYSHLAAGSPDLPTIDLSGRHFEIEGVVVQRNLGRRIKHYSAHPGSTVAAGEKG